MSERKKPKPLSSIDLEKLRDLYVVQKLSLTDTASALDISYSSVWKLLEKMGISTRGLAKYDLEEARNLYFEKGWTLQQIADKLEVSRQAVHSRLTNAGYNLKLRPPRRPYIDREALEPYLDQDISIRKIADKLGTDLDTVNRSLKHHGLKRTRIPKSHRRFDRELIEDLYIKQGLFQREIAAKLGVNTQDIANELKRHNITFRHPPAKRIVRPDREVLDRLYTDEGLSFVEIGRRVGLSAGTVIKFVDEYGIKRRPKGRGLYALGVSRDQLYELYVTKNMSRDDIAGMYGVTSLQVYDSLRRYGIAVRPEPRTGERPKIAPILGYEEIHKLYIIDNMTRPQIAEMFGVSLWSVEETLRKYKIRKFQTANSA